MKMKVSFAVLCRCLQNADRDSPCVCASVPEKRVDWYEVARVADANFVTPLLYHRLVQKDLLALLPEDLQALLAEIHKLNRQRNELVYSEINSIANLLNPAGIEPIFIKGSAALLMDLYDNRGLRVMNDVDFLVDQKDLATCMELMRSVGFHAMDGVNIPADFYHQKPLVHARHSIRFEVHVRLSHQSVLASEAIIADSTEIRMPAGIVRVPSTMHFTIHNILHHQVFDHGLLKGRVPLYQLYDLYTIRERWSSEIDWQVICDFFTGHSLPAAYYCSIGMLRGSFDQQPPAGLRFLTVKMFGGKYQHIKHRCKKHYSSSMHRCYQWYVRCRSLFKQ